MHIDREGANPPIGRVIDNRHVIVQRRVVDQNVDLPEVRARLLDQLDTVSLFGHIRGHR